MFTIDETYLADCFRRIIDVPSPVGYYEQLNPVLEQLAAECGQRITYDRRGTAYITLPGQDNSKTVMLSAHADTLGLMVRSVEGNGMLRVRPIGGINFCNLDGEYVTVLTRDGRTYTGMMISQAYSLHVFPDARTLPRNEDTMLLTLDEPVASREDVHALGIRNGDYVFIEPHCRFTENGYLKSRFIDDKGPVACLFTALCYLSQHHLQPRYTTILSIPYREEIGQGGCYVPPEVSEFVAVDIGLVGPEHDATDHDVSICARDKDGPYDYALTNHLIDCAKKANCSYAVDVFYHYSSDSHAALRGGANVAAAVFGPCTLGSHGVERTHLSALVNTTKLVLAYMLDI